jgi:hypothetical protein
MFYFVCANTQLYFHSVAFNYEIHVSPLNLWLGSPTHWTIFICFEFLLQPLFVSGLDYVLSRSKALHWSLHFSRKGGFEKRKSFLAFV